MLNRVAPAASSARCLFMMTALLASAAAFAPSASAQEDEVVVLGIRSLEGDDEFARNLTGAVRHSSSQVAGWTVSDREVTLAQMSLVHGCEEVTAACMGEIAGSLEASRIIYGEVRRTSTADRYDFELTLSLFEAGSGEQTIVERTFAGERTDIDDVREPIRELVSRLSGAPQVGRLVVASNVPNAEVFVDGESVGTTDDDGALTLDEVEAGERQIRVVADGHASFTEAVAVEASGEASLQAQLVEGQSDEGGNDAGGGGGGGVSGSVIAGVGLLAVGAASAGLWIWSMTEVDAVNNHEDFTRARNMFSDPCDSTSDTVIELCDRGTTHEVLQFVFLGTALLSAGLGAYLVVDGLGGDEDDAQAARLRLMPALDPRGGGYVAVDGRF